MKRAMAMEYRLRYGRLVEKYSGLFNSVIQDSIA